ncbi:alcohol dehydrogenase catalytic domain-containing protein [Streptomyces sp. NPDC051219]|uniref:alcohol dehydrogenase catalytic domain-containing protein n=1 Tax=Streptomyces sp. NPDC051219 TaxID=3155283 RepID=UPI0034185809
MTQMDAYRIIGWGKGAYQSVPVPEPGVGEILLEVKGAGLCASDLHFLRLPPGGWGSSPPWTLGHENAGVVAAVGPGATRFGVGDAVLATGIHSCGSCRYCVRGHDNLCPKATGGRGVGIDGGFARYVVVPDRELVGLTNLEPRVAAPLADAGHTSYGAVAHVIERLAPGATALVIGAGGVGSYAVQYLKVLTSARVVVAEPSAGRREYVTELGADVAIESGPTTVEAVRDLTGGRGADAIIDFVGNASSIQTALASAAPLAKIALVGMGDADVRLSWSKAPAIGAEVSWRMGATVGQLEEVVSLAERGLLRIDNEYFAFDQIERAMELLGAGQLRGRAVIEPGRLSAS